MVGKNKNIVSYVVLGLWSLIILGIFFWVLMSSFKTNLEIYTSPWTLPETPTFENSSAPGTP